MDKEGYLLLLFLLLLFALSFIEDRREGVPGPFASLPPFIRDTDPL